VVASFQLTVDSFPGVFSSPRSSWGLLEDIVLFVLYCSRGEPFCL